MKQKRRTSRRRQRRDAMRRTQTEALPKQKKTEGKSKPALPQVTTNLGSERS